MENREASENTFENAGYSGGEGEIGMNRLITYSRKEPIAGPSRMSILLSVALPDAGFTAPGARSILGSARYRGQGS